MEDKQNILDRRYMKMAEIWAENSYCKRRKVGALIVKDKMILAAEAIEGTDRCIERGGKLGGKGITVVKVSKPTQDKRFDIPAIGLNTLKTMARHGAKILAVEANETILVDAKKTIEFADKNNIVIMAV